MSTPPKQPEPYIRLVLDQMHPMSDLRRITMTFDVTVGTEEMVQAFKGLLVATNHPPDAVEDLIPDPDDWVEFDGDDDEDDGGSFLPKKPFDRRPPSE